MVRRGIKKNYSSKLKMFVQCEVVQENQENQENL